MMVTKSPYQIKAFLVRTFCALLLVGGATRSRAAPCEGSCPSIDYISLDAGAFLMGDARALPISSATPTVTVDLNAFLSKNV